MSSGKHRLQEPTMAATGRVWPYLEGEEEPGRKADVAEPLPAHGRIHSHAPQRPLHCCGGKKPRTDAVASTTAATTAIDAATAAATAADAVVHDHLHENESHRLAPGVPRVGVHRALRSCD